MGRRTGRAAAAEREDGPAIGDGTSGPRWGQTPFSVVRHDGRRRMTDGQVGAVRGIVRSPSPTTAPRPVRPPASWAMPETPAGPGPGRGSGRGPGVVDAQVLVHLLEDQAGIGGDLLAGSQAPRDDDPVAPLLLDLDLAALELGGPAPRRGAL